MEQQVRVRRRRRRPTAPDASAYDAPRSAVVDTDDADELLERIDCVLSGL